jgi:hypothetical protein
LKTAANTEVGARSGTSSTDAEAFSAVQRERFSGHQLPLIVGQRKWRSEEDASQVAAGLKRRPRQTDFQRRGIWRVPD